MESKKIVPKKSAYERIKYSYVMIQFVGWKIVHKSTICVEISLANW